MKNHYMTDRKRILQLSTRDQRGGAEQIANTLFRQYRERGHHSWMIVGKKYSQDPNIWEMCHAAASNQRWSRAFLHLSESLAPLRRKGIRGIGAVQSRLRLLAQPNAWLDRRQGFEDFHFPGTWDLFRQLPFMPDIVHCHNLHGGYFDLTVLPWLSQKLPTILHLHDTWLLSGHCAHSLDCERWRSGCGNCPYLNTYPAISRDRSAENWRYKQAIYAQSRLYVVAVSQWLMDQVNASMLQGAKQAVIHNGIDLTTFRPATQQAARQALDLPPQAQIILYSGHSDFKDSSMSNEILAALTGQDLLFICVGQSGRARALGSGHLLKRGYIKEAEQMAQYLQAADLYLHVAKADSFPTTVLEAMACGTPVVATAVGGIPEQIVDGQTGLLVPPGEPKALARAIQRLLEDSELRRRMGNAAVAYVQQHFNTEQQADVFLAWYEEVMENWRINQLQEYEDYNLSIGEPLLSK